MPSGGHRMVKIGMNFNESGPIRPAFLSLIRNNAHFIKIIAKTFGSIRKSSYLCSVKIIEAARRENIEHAAPFIRLAAIFITAPRGVSDNDSKDLASMILTARSAVNLLSKT